MPLPVLVEPPVPVSPVLGDDVTPAVAVGIVVAEPALPDEPASVSVSVSVVGVVPLAVPSPDVELDPPSEPHAAPTINNAPNSPRTRRVY